MCIVVRMRVIAKLITKTRDAVGRRDALASVTDAA
jgi:hypothetical protein